MSTSARPEWMRLAGSYLHEHEVWRCCIGPGEKARSKRFPSSVYLTAIDQNARLRYHRETRCAAKARNDCQGFPTLPFHEKS
jgi:hypothetical protein